MDHGLRLDDFARRLLSWHDSGYMTPDGRVFDVGIQTRQAFARLERGISADQSGPAGEMDNGNGSLMRCLPVVFFADSTEDLIDLAMRQSLPTHGALRSQLCCALYALTASGILAGSTPLAAVNRAEDTLKARFAGDSDAVRDELAHILAARSLDGYGSGYVLDSLWSAINCVLTTHDYESCVRRAIQLGRDTDTTACIAGGLAGLAYGYDGIPARWLDTLQGREIVERCLNCALQKKRKDRSENH